MATVNTKDTLDSMFKYAVADSVNNLIPENVKLLKMLGPIQQAEKIGRKYLCPVALTLENGVTYGDGSAFTLNDAVAGVYEEIELESYPAILRSQISQSAANRMAGDKKSFVSWASLRAENMHRSLAKRAEIEMWYGKAGLATVSAISTVNSTTEVLTISAATWAPGIWAGLEGAQIEIRDGSTGRAGHTTNSLVIASVDYANKQITVTGNQTELTAVETNIANGQKIFFKGAYSNSMYGIDSQLTNTGSLLGIDAATYGLWKSDAYAAGSAALSMSKVLKALALPVAKGGLDEKVTAFVSATTYENMNSDYAALRSVDQSYDKMKGENGVEKLVFHGQNGPVEIVASSIIKEGEAFILPLGKVKRVGATDLTFNTGTSEGDFFLPLASSAGYELRCQYDFAVLVEAPAKCVKVTGIVNS